MGIDHALSLPLEWFERHSVPRDWRAMLDEVATHWPADRPGVTVRSLRENNPRGGESVWRRVTDARAGAKSPFHFDVPGAVASATLAGLPFLRALAREHRETLHAWPFDGFTIPPNSHVLAEAYPAVLRAPDDDAPGRTPDQRDAHAIARWLREANGDGRLARALAPELTDEHRETARIEGWILGLT